jgi:hypothetical protein
MIFNWFSAAESRRFGNELAAFIMSELQGSLHKRDAKFAAKAEKTLRHAATRVQQFESRERMNFFKRAKVANAFLWSLKDSGCPEEYANELTDWLTMRL